MGCTYLEFGAWEVKEGWDLKVLGLFGKYFPRPGVARSQYLLRPETEQEGSIDRGDS